MGQPTDFLQNGQELVSSGGAYARLYNTQASI